MAKGIEQGKELGIKVLIETCIELGVSKEDTLLRLEEKFSLTERVAMEYLSRFWI